MFNENYDPKAAEKWFAVEWINSKPAAVHVINFPGIMQRGGYVQGTSLGYFKQRETKSFADRYRAGKPVPRHFIIKPGAEYVFDKESMMESLAAAKGEAVKPHHYDALPHTEYSSVFAFYEGIGYDYKKKRYI